MSSSGTTSGSARFSAREIGGRAARTSSSSASTSSSLNRRPLSRVRTPSRLCGPSSSEERQHEPGPDGIQALRADEVAGERDLDRPRAPVVGEAHPRDVVRLGLRQPDRRDDRRPVTAGDERDRALSSRALARNLESAHHRLGVVADVEGTAGRRLLERRERVVQRLGELRQPVVVAAQHRDRDLGLA